MSGYTCSDSLLASVALLSALSHPITYYSYAHGLRKLDGLATKAISLKLLSSSSLLWRYCRHFFTSSWSLQRLVIKRHLLTGLLGKILTD